jgi:hypothetical protein
MIGLAMCLERGLVVIDFIEREMVWIAGEVEDVVTAAAPFSLSAARKLSRSAGKISRSTELTYIPADCASTRWLVGSKTKQAAASANVAVAKEIDLSMLVSLPECCPGLFPVKGAVCLPVLDAVLRLRAIHNPSRAAG